MKSNVDLRNNLAAAPAVNANDTICAISTAPGVGGIAVIRISGPLALTVADAVWRGKPITEQAANTVRFGRIIDTERNGELLDEAVATVFRAPASFTGEDVVELSVHGSRYVQRRLLELLNQNGARLAEPGEFTRRAFANGKMDLAQAEAVADVIASNSRAAHRLAASQLKGAFSARLNQLRDQLLELASLLELELDFSEEEVEFASRQHLRDIATEIHREVTRLYRSFSAGTAIKDGIPVAIIGPTNAGKSSLLNLLLGEDRAIVSDIHGTTRDTIEDTIEIGDYLFRFIDTAGLRTTTDPIEALGIERSLQARSRASIVISVLDASQPATHLAAAADAAMTGNAAATADVPAYAADSSDAAPVILLLNKADLCTASVQNLEGEASVSDVLKVGQNCKGDASKLGNVLKFGQYKSGETVVKPFVTIPFSTKTGQGQQQLLDALTTLADRLRGTADEDTLLVTNLRHAQALQSAADSTAAIITGLQTNLPGDLIAQDLRATIHHLSSITGTLTTPDILASIFSRFCIGK
jgi:tRNA modification GTPase